MAAFQTLLGLGTGHKSATRKDLYNGRTFSKAYPGQTTSYWGLLKQPDKHEYPIFGSRSLVDHFLRGLPAA
jgi:hypothetical protein